MRLRDRLGVSKRLQRRISWLLQLALVGFFFIGLDRGDPGIVVNSGVALAVAQLPAMFERDYDIAMDPALVLWLTSAAFLHALGTVGIPGTSLLSLYSNVWWWDHITHALSSSVVAGAGYAFVLTVDRHARNVNFPPAFTLVFLFLVVIAFGVVWEVLEFALARVGEIVGGSVLTQYGLEDTMLDLIFDAVGGALVAIWGTAYLTDVAGEVADRLQERPGRRGE